MNPIPIQGYCWFAFYILILSGFIFRPYFAFKSISPRLVFLTLFSGLVALAWVLSLVSWLGLFVSYFGFLIAYLRPPPFCWLYWLWWFLLALLSLALATHQIDGFNNIEVFTSHSFGRSELPVALYANIDKAVAALILLAAFGKNELWTFSKASSKWLSLTILGFFLFASALGAEIEFKLTQLTIAFMILNLFTTCVAEEAFFRLVIQNHLARVTQYFNVWNGLPIVVTALIFTLAHFHTFEGYEQRLTLIFSAGLLYGVAYSRFNFGVAVGLHFLINAIHFVFFAYPASFA